MSTNPETSYLLELWDKNICPSCGQLIPEGKRIGSGKKDEGGFCSMDCLVQFQGATLIERAKKVAELAAKHRNQ